MRLVWAIRLHAQNVTFKGALPAIAPIVSSRAGCTAIACRVRFANVGSLAVGKTLWIFAALS